MIELPEMTIDLSESEDERAQREAAQAIADHARAAIPDDLGQTNEDVLASAIAPAGRAQPAGPATSQPEPQAASGLSAPRPASRVPLEAARALSGKGEADPRGGTPFPGEKPPSNDAASREKYLTEDAFERALAESQSKGLRARLLGLAAQLLSSGRSRVDVAGMGREAEQRALDEYRARVGMAQGREDERRRQAAEIRAAKEREEELAYRRSRDESKDAFQDRALTLQEENATAARDRMGAEESRAAALSTPDSLISRADQMALKAARDSLGVSPEALSDEAIDGMSASTIRENPALRQMLQAQQSANLAQLRRRRGGGSGRGRTAPAEEGGDRREQLIQYMIRNEGMTREDAEVAVPQDGDKIEQLSRSIGAGMVSRGERERENASRRDEQHAVPGWSRIDGAPELNASERSQARDLVAEDASIRQAAFQLSKLAEEISALEAAGAAAGVLNQRMARARQLQEQVSNSLRTIGNYGVPQAAELARMERLAPQLESVQGLLSAAPIYRQLAVTMRQKVNTRMQVLGYQRGRGGS